MKNTFRYLLVAILSIAIVSCGKDPQPKPEPEPEKPALNQNLSFTLEVAEVTPTSAKINVSNNGTTNDTWYGFATTNTNVNEAISEKYAELTSAASISGLKKQTSYTANVSGLEPETEYVYITFGLSEDGELYGKAASVEFTTPRDTDKVEKTNDWKISYTRGENQGQTAEIFTVECENGKGYYFTTVSKSDLEYNNLSIEDYVRYVIKSEVPELLSYGYTWAELYIDESYTLAYQRMNSGDYIAIAVGYDQKGNSTGYYSTLEFTIAEEAASAEYNQWLGNWDFTYSYQYKDEATGEVMNATATYHVGLSHYDNNFMYLMTGWEETGDCNDIREYVGEYIVPVYYNNGKLEFRETTLDLVNFSEYGDYYFGFYGIADITIDGKVYEGNLSASDGLTMAIAETTDGGKTGMITGNKVETSGYTIDYLGMFYCAYPAAGSGELAYWNYPMEFPITMTKVEGSDVQQQSISIQSRLDSDCKTLTARKKINRPVCIEM